MSAANETEKTVSTENSNTNMMTVEIPIITPVVPEIMTITSSASPASTESSAAPPPPPPTTAPPSSGAEDTVDFKKMDINDQLQSPAPPTVTTTVTIITKGNRFDK